MNRLRGALLAALLAGCGKLPTTEDGVAFLDIIPPATLTIPVGGTVRIIARALNSQGEPVEVAIAWRTPDTTITVDDQGLVLGVSAGVGRVQAAIGDNPRLVSNFIEITVTEPEPPGAPPR